MTENTTRKLNGDSQSMTAEELKQLEKTNPRLAELYREADEMAQTRQAIFESRKAAPGGALDATLGDQLAQLVRAVCPEGTWRGPKSPEHPHGTRPPTKNVFTGDPSKSRTYAGRGARPVIHNGRWVHFGEDPLWWEPKEWGQERFDAAYAESSARVRSGQGPDHETNGHGGTGSNVEDHISFGPPEG